MRSFAREHGKRSKIFEPGALVRLQAHSWPGNVRELRNVIERLIIMVQGDLIAERDLAFLETDGPDAHGPDVVDFVVVSLHEARDQFERDYILRTLASQHGNISRTADLLGVERSNLYRKMRGIRHRSGRALRPGSEVGKRKSPGVN